MSDEIFKAASANPQNCWEFWQCPQIVKDGCYAYRLNAGKECWRITESIIPKPAESPRIKNKIPYCGECGWFKWLKPDFIH